MSEGEQGGSGVFIRIPSRWLAVTCLKDFPWETGKTSKERHCEKQKFF
jgi:hypothetical protein